LALAGFRFGTAVSDSTETRHYRWSTALSDSDPQVVTYHYYFVFVLMELFGHIMNRPFGH